MIASSDKRMYPIEPHLIEQWLVVVIPPVPIGDWDLLIKHSIVFPFFVGIFVTPAFCTNLHNNGGPVTDDVCEAHFDLHEKIYEKNSEMNKNLWMRLFWNR